MPVRYSTASRSVFDGIVPVLVHTPPSIWLCSISATDLPSLAAAMAAFCPPGPEPMTTRSYSLMDGCIFYSPVTCAGWRVETEPARRGREDTARPRGRCERRASHDTGRSGRPEGQSSCLLLT